MRSKPRGSTSSSIAGDQLGDVRAGAAPRCAGVNALLTSFRSRVWSGGSIMSIVLGRSMLAEVHEVGPPSADGRGSELIVGSRRIRSQSSQRVNTNSSHSGNALIGVSARIWW